MTYCVFSILSFHVLDIISIWASLLLKIPLSSGECCHMQKHSLMNQITVPFTPIKKLSHPSGRFPVVHKTSPEERRARSREMGAQLPPGSQQVPRGSSQFLVQPMTQPGKNYQETVHFIAAPATPTSPLGPNRSSTIQTWNQHSFVRQGNCSVSPDLKHYGRENDIVYFKLSK